MIKWERFEDTKSLPWYIECQKGHTGRVETIDVKDENILKVNYSGKVFQEKEDLNWILASVVKKGVAGWIKEMCLERGIGRYIASFRLENSEDNLK